MTKKAKAKPEQMREQEQAASLAETGRCAYASIAEMVAALECDYDRLEELCTDRDDWSVRHKEGNEQTDYENGSLDADELKELTTAAGDDYDADKTAEGNREAARERIEQDALSIEVRSGWYPPGDDQPAPEEFRILLSTGGPATRIIGELTRGEPSSATLQAQDWGTPWTDYRDADEETLLAYCRCFYFGEG